MQTIRVYFAEQARTATLDAGQTVREYVRHLKRDGDTYLASTRQDYLALRPYEHSPAHVASEPQPPAAEDKAGD